ncbi:uncharacterized protein LOC125057499 [Pieris napi]|uniref:uncharacterized protein LOC125057499 n=1 Tax=Pieris napi TaxID=78633 RepID=UPI001FB9C75D|nr:uncharacterized protein LOC125057499 [Pieris napi]
MEIWEKFIDAGTSFKDISSFKKIISSARIVLTNDLTDFESDWFVSTLLRHPVNLLDTLQKKRGDSVWIESIVDALALLANLLQTHNGLHLYYHQIVQVCSMVSDGACRTPALTCLLHTSHHSAAPANLQHLIAEFEYPRVSSRGPLGLLIGSICRSWPQVIEEQGERVWRVFLQVLEDEQLSGTARAAVLEGASGILSAFGLELPTADLLGFYNLLRTAVFLHPRCHTVCMRILRCHVSLFSERACEDTTLRMRLWELGVEPAYRALSAIYHQMARNRQLYPTLAAEVLKYAGASQAAGRVVAFRALYELHTLPDSNVVSPLCYIHVPKLECKLRGDVLNDDVVLIAWCIETGVSGSSELVSAWIERNTPLLSSREQQLARAVLAAPNTLRKWTIHVMVTESCCSTRRQRSITLCQYLFDVSSEKNSENESDRLYAMAEMLDILVEEVLNVVGGHSTDCRKEGDCEPIAGISALVCVALRSGNSGAAVAGARLVRALSSCGVRHPAAIPAALSAALASPLAPSTIELKTLRVESLRDAETQWQCCEVVCSSGIAPPQFLANFTLAAAEIVLSSGRAETTLFCACVRTLAALVRTHRDSIDKILLNEVSKRIAELPARSSAHSRIERELRREILLFLGQCPLQASDKLVRHATYDIDLGKHDIASALEAATHTPSLKVEEAQKMADYLSKILRSKRPSDPPISILIWLARSGADLLPFAAIFPQRALPELFQSVERERSAVTRKALAALATAVLKTLPPGDQEMQLRFLLTTIQDSTQEGRLEILLAASQAVRDDSVSLRAAILKAFAVNGGLHLTSSPVSCVPPADLISSLLSGPLPPRFPHFYDRRALESISSDCTDLVVEAIDDNCNFGRLLNVLNEIRGSPGLSRRVCSIRDGIVPRKLFALECIAPDVAFQFIAWNAEVLMEINSESTIDTVCKLIESVKIDDIRAIRNLAECVQRVRLENSDVNKLYEASENWLRKQNLYEVTRELRRNELKTEWWEVVQGVRGMIKATGVKSDVVGEEAVNWAKAVREIYDAGIERYAPHKPYLLDVLCVALPALNIQEFEELFNDDVNFCRWAVPALVYLIEQKGNDQPLKKSQIVELLPMFCKAPVEFVDRLWADFESNSTFEEKIEAALVIGAGEACLWAERIVLEDTPPLQMLQLLPLVPSDMRRRMASSALAAAGVTGAGGVARAKEGVAVAAVRALLAATPGLELVDIIATLADDETECDWFEAALSQWARNAAANAYAADILQRLHELCWDARTRGVLRVLIPMLRAIDPSLVEDLMSQWSNRLIGAIRVKPRPGGDRRALIRCLNDYVRALTLLTIAFERVPRAHHERPDAKLHQELSSQPFQLVREVSTLCVALRQSVRTAYDDNLRELFRVFECANFKCLSAALFCRQGASSTFRALLDDAVWERLVQTSISLPIVTQSYATPRPVETASVQSRVFLSTLTDDPLLYDLHEGVLQTETSDAEMVGQAGAIWVHECTYTLSILLRHSVRSLPPDLYLTPVRAALATSRTRPLRWLLAQAVCDVPSLVDTLRDDLLAVALDTAENGLNAIQLYVLSVVKPVPLDVARATGVLTALVLTAVELESRSPRLLIDTLESWSRAHAGLVLPDTCYKEYVADSGRKRWSCMSVMRRVCSSGIRVAGLVGELGTVAVSAANDVRTLRSIGATLGSALTADTDKASDEKVHKAMVAVRKQGGAGAYLTLLAAAASVYPALVNADNARIVTDMATKIIGRDKQKCLRILCAFAKNAKHSDEQIADIFDLVEPTVSLTCDPLIIDLCTAALPYARQAARDRVVTIAAQIATPLASPSLQRAAYLLLFAEITRRVEAEREGRKEVEPPTKRRAGCVHSPILSLWEDMAWRGVLSRTVYALDHTDSNIVKGALQALSNALSVDDQYTRCKIAAS